MENQDYVQTGGFAQQDLSVTEAGVGYLKETARWGKFLAIVGFVMIGFMVLMALMVGALAQSMFGPNMPFSGSILTFFYLALALVYLFPVLFLYRFAKSAGDAVLSRNANSLTVALGNLKSLYKFMGILVLIFLGLYILGILFAFVGGVIGSLI